MGDQYVRAVAENESGQDTLPCILMFSGGRDSTVAAIRLAKTSERLVLITVTSEHLHGIAVVRQRLKELCGLLPPATRWMHVIEPEALSKHVHFGALTCLPCHRSYTAIGIALARKIGASVIAYGYAGYQSSWPEQTPDAIARLERVASANGVRLILPVYDLSSKDEAIAELDRMRLTPDALEQKCSRQFKNEALSESALHVELNRWEIDLHRSIQLLSAEDVHVVTDCILSDIGEAVK